MDENNSQLADDNYFQFHFDGQSFLINILVCLLELFLASATIVDSFPSIVKHDNASKPANAGSDREKKISGNVFWWIMRPITLLPEATEKTKNEN